MATNLGRMDVTWKILYVSLAKTYGWLTGKQFALGVALYEQSSPFWGRAPGAHPHGGKSYCTVEEMTQEKEGEELLHGHQSKKILKSQQCHFYNNIFTCCCPSLSELLASLEGTYSKKMNHWDIEACLLGFDMSQSPLGINGFPDIIHDADLSVEYWSIYDTFLLHEYWLFVCPVTSI